MNAARLISGPSRRLLSVLSTGHWPCRNIWTGNSQPTLGHAGGGRLITGGHTGQLDAFLGRWHLEKMAYYKNHHNYQKTGMKVLSKVEPSLRPSLAFEENDGMWTLQLGDADTDNSLCYNFYFGEGFLMLYPNGKLMQTVIYPEGEFIKWEQQNLDVPSDMLKVITEVRGQRLTWKTKYPDGTKLMKKYARK